jgi:hypothetical protein
MSFWPLKTSLQCADRRCGVEESGTILFSWSLTRGLKEMMVLASQWEVYVGERIIAQTSPVRASFWVGVAEDAKRIKSCFVTVLKDWLREREKRGASG